MISSPMERFDHSPPARSRGRWFKTLFVAALILGDLCFAFDKWGGGIRLRARMLLAQRRCLRCSFPPTTVVFDSDPKRAVALISHGYVRRGIASALIAPAVFPDIQTTLDAFENALLAIASRGTSAVVTPAPFVFFTPRHRLFPNSNEFAIFLHERFSPSGQVRLVVCKAVVREGTDKTLMALGASAIEPAPLTGLQKSSGPPGGAEELPIWRPGFPDQLRLFAGQADSVNPSRFTIDYEAYNGRGTIEGILRNDDSVKLRIVDGPMSMPGPVPPPS